MRVNETKFATENPFNGDRFGFRGNKKVVQVSLQYFDLYFQY